MDAFLGEIRIFAGNYPPRGWAFCDGRLLPLSQYTTLFSILGNQYGGDGRTTFALPNLSGSAPMGQGQGPGLSPRYVGEPEGMPTVALRESEMPIHTHTPFGISSPGGEKEPEQRFWAETPKVGKVGTQTALYGSTPDSQMSPMALASTGEGAPHNNMQPYLAVNYIICLDGAFPVRS
ncbi:phage tail protein [Cohnella zeiphila]|uniref:Phage tail protein n=1 Tax=Cohnella zeiphila TaxID=2761120 RepID=A0A7X0SPT5_9BACL|nr:tail fiber protein [Cohnella zeiphila]MBB6733849.1 phage tail protein [Cohnella zeiphila]